MAMESTLELINYYAKLLIIQYVGLPKAYNTIVASATPILMPQTSTQLIKFSSNPTGGTYKLNYKENDTVSINWDDNAETITSILQALPELSQVIVTGTTLIGFTVLFRGVNGVAQLLTVPNNNLTPSTSISIVETDLTLPLAVQNAFDLETAVGVQLDILGKYTGVKRTVTTKNQTIFLEDDEFRILIKFAIVKNNSGSSLGTIEKNLNMFFPGDFIVTDYKTMYMSFIFGSNLGSKELFLAIIAEKLLPVPMAVGYTAIVPPVIDQFFGYSEYDEDGNPQGNKPYNNYDDFQTDWIYLEYDDVI